MFRKLLTTTAASLTLCGLAALPAHASPEDGEGCAGLPDFPAAYVCVISITPAAVAPTVTTSYLPVTVPRVCYFAGCTSATTVPVPVPGATLSSGNVAVVWYQGTYYPIGFGTGGVLTPIVDEVVADATATVNGAVATVDAAVDSTVATVDAAVDSATAQVNATVTATLNLVNAQVQAALDAVPTTDELNAMIQDLYANRVVPLVAFVQETEDKVLQAIANELIPILELWQEIWQEIQDFDADQEVRDIVERLQPTFDRLGTAIQNLLDSISI